MSTTTQQWTREEVLEEIKRLSRDGIAPSTFKHQKLRRMAEHYFGSWRSACERAGVQPRRPGKLASVAERMEFLRRNPDLRLRLRVFILAVEHGYWQHGVNPFAGLDRVGL